MDVHNVCLVVAVLSLSVSGVVVWLAFVRPGVDNQSSRQERHIRALLRDIQSSQTQTQNTSDREMSMLVVPPDSPWRGLDRTLGNYFTHGYFNHKGKYHQEYTHSPLTILPFFHDEGGEFERCLRKTALAHNQAVSPDMTFGNRLKWDTSYEGLFKFKHKFKLHYGRASFMVCDWGGSGGGAETGLARCGHAFIMQDPLMLAITDLSKCLLEPKDQPLCQQVLQNKTSVEEWIAARGSIVFKHILFHSEICQNADSQHKAQLHQPKSHHLTPHQLCQKNHDTYIDNLQPDTINQLVNFITRNVHKLFSVVGLFEDFGKSLALLNRVFRLPLHECEFLSRFSQASSAMRPKYVHMMKQNAADDTLQNKIRFDLVDKLSYKNIASLLRINTDDEDGYTLLHAFRHIENSMSRSRETVAISSPNSSISENHERLDIMFDYDILDVNTSDSHDLPDVNTSDSRGVPDVNTSDSPDLQDVNTSDSHDLPDVNTSDSRGVPDVNTSDSPDLQDVNTSDSHDFLDVNTNVDVSDGDSSMDVVRNPDSNTTPKSNVLYYKERTEDGQLDDDSDEDNEDEDEDEGDDSQKDLTPDNTLLLQAMLLQARKLQEDAVRTRLYSLFKDNHQIIRILSPDMRIYKAVKRLYSHQKRLFFNSIKTI